MSSILALFTHPSTLASEFFFFNNSSNFGEHLLISAALLGMFRSLSEKSESWLFTFGKHPRLRGWFNMANFWALEICIDMPPYILPPFWQCWDQIMSINVSTRKQSIFNTDCMELYFPVVPFNIHIFLCCICLDKLWTAHNCKITTNIINFLLYVILVAGYRWPGYDSEGHIVSHCHYGQIRDVDFTCVLFYSSCNNYAL